MYNSWSNWQGSTSHSDRLQLGGAIACKHIVHTVHYGDEWRRLAYAYLRVSSNEGFVGKLWGIYM